MTNDIVIDANIIISSLLNKNSKFINLILQDDIRIFSPNYVIMEIFDKKEKILKYSSMKEREFMELFIILIEKIHFVGNDLVTMESREKAYNLCKNVDKKDIPFVALAIELNCNFWTGDKKLIKGLQRLNYNNFFSI